MCGIAGVVDRRGNAAEVSAAQAELLRHRGPDATGVFDRGIAALVQTRLSIIDVRAGDPPIGNEAGDVGIAFNGEIYNYRALQRRLTLSGHTLRTDCDTEVVVHLAEDLEPAELARLLDGMFAFAVWDDRKHRLVLARDRFGKKPLHYWCDGTRFVFGSEIKAVLADPRVSRSLDVAAVKPYLTFGYVPTPRTIYEGIQSLPPGHVLTFEAGTGSVRLERYWEPPVAGVDGIEAFDLTLEEAATEVRRLLAAAVSRRLMSDVPLGAFLSGGVDSSTVVALMASATTDPVETFTIGFDDEDGFDERPYASEVAALFGTDHTEFVVRPDKAELIERLVSHHDQPFGDSSALPTFLLSELTAKKVTVALSGDGGDELFAGYERFTAAVALARAASLPAGARAAIARASGSTLLRRAPARLGSVTRMLRRAGDEMPDAYLSWLAYVPFDWAERLVPAAPNFGMDDARQRWARTEGAATLDRLLDLNIRTYLLDDLLPKVDRMSMAHGLEVRSPLLDTALAEFVLRLPPRTKLRGLARKRVLKAAMADVLPPHLLNRRKRGFGIPLDRWFRTDLRSYVDARLGAPDARVLDHVDRDALAALLAEHANGRANHGHAIWTLLTFEVFLRDAGW